jgi:hypothetical protein
MQPYNDVDKLVHNAIKSILNELFAHHYAIVRRLKKDQRCGEYTLAKKFETSPKFLIFHHFFSFFFFFVISFFFQCIMSTTNTVKKNKRRKKRLTYSLFLKNIYIESRSTTSCQFCSHLGHRSHPQFFPQQCDLGRL